MIDPDLLLDVAKCCTNSARMLEMSDQPLADETARPFIRKANVGQAGLLRECARLLTDASCELSDMIALIANG